MTLWPAFRTERAASLEITWWACLLGYGTILVVIPAVAWAIRQLAVLALDGSGITRTPAGPALRGLEFMVEALAFSPLYSWQGCLVSLPFVYAARLWGWFGWGTAMAVGALVYGLVMAPQGGLGLGGLTVMLIILSSGLGVGFWATVRLIHPRAFAAGAMAQG